MNIIDSIKKTIKKSLLNKGLLLPRKSKIENCIVYPIDDFENWCMHRYFQDFADAQGATRHLLDMKTLHSLALYTLEFVPNKQKEARVLEFQRKLTYLYSELNNAKYDGIIVLKSTQEVGNPE